MPTLLSLGHGYSARALASRLLPRGWRVIGTTRSPDKAREIAATGAEPVIWPDARADAGADGALAALLAQASHVLVSAGPGPDGDPVLLHGRRAITGAAAGLEWLGYLSTTGVYGDHKGDWVDEDTALTPATQRGVARQQAEADWHSIPGLALHVFRLAGIYGPGRGPFAKVRAGTARRIVKPGQVFSRIHVADIARALELSMAAPRPGAVYNLCDDDPAPPQDVIAHAAQLLGLPVPPAIPFDKADLSPMARSFYAESKRVRNDRAKAELGWQPAFPDYRAGLAALLADGAEVPDDRDVSAGRSASHLPGRSAD